MELVLLPPLTTRNSCTSWFSLIFRFLPSMWLHHKSWEETGNKIQKNGHTIFRHVWSCTCPLQRRKSRSRLLGTRRTPMTGRWGGGEGRGRGGEEVGKKEKREEKEGRGGKRREREERRRGEKRKGGGGGERRKGEEGKSKGLGKTTRLIKGCSYHQFACLSHTSSIKS